MLSNDRFSNMSTTRWSKPGPAARGGTPGGTAAGAGAPGPATEAAAAAAAPTTPIPAACRKPRRLGVRSPSLPAARLAIASPSSSADGVRSFGEEAAEPVGVEDRDAQLFGLGQLGAGARPGGDEVGLLRDARRRLAARSQDRLDGTLPAEAFESSGRHDRDAGQDAALDHASAGTGVPRGRQLHAGRGPPLEDLLVPVHREPVEQRVGDDRPDPLDG